MITCSSFIRIFSFIAVLFSVGCGHGVYSSNVGGPESIPPAVSDQATPVSAQPLPLPPAKKPISYDVGSGYDCSYRHDVLTEDVTWSGKVLVRGGLIIASQATLNIRPGTIVSFVPDQDGTMEGVLLVQGRIAAVGSAEKPIIFKAAASSTVPGSWRGIIVLGSEKRNVFEYCRIEGASVGIDAVFSTVSQVNTSIVSCGTGIRLQNSLFQAYEGRVSGCALGYALIDSECDIRGIACTGNNVALSLVRGSLSLKDSSFSGNAGRALEAQKAQVMISGTSFDKNKVGIVFTDTEGSIESSGIIENREYGIQVFQSRVKIFGNRIYMNTGVGIMIDTGGSAAWGNTISLNGLHDVYNAGTEDFRAIGNWWGASTTRQKRIYDVTVDPGRGQVLTQPELSAPPVRHY